MPRGPREARLRAVRRRPRRRRARRRGRPRALRSRAAQRRSGRRSARALDAAVFDGVPVWDFGGAGVGDPATDVIAAWSVFGPAGRAVYRDALGVDDGTWRRARGIALHQAVMIVPYYAQTNPAFVALAQRTIAQVLADGG